MGESILGLPNRFKIVNNLLESTYNPNHTLSAYQGHKLSTDYVNRSGGLDFAMTGPFHTKSLLPSENAYYGRYGTLCGDDIGSYDKRYRYIHAVRLYGIADSATKLVNPITLSVTGAVAGSVTFNGTGNIDLNVTSSHNHDGKYLPITGGTVSGNVIFGGNDIGLLDKNKRQLLYEDSSGTLHIGRGPYNSNTGTLSLYSRGYMNLYTKQDDIRLFIESSTHSPQKPYISIGADSTGAYIKYSKNAARLYLGENDSMTYNGYSIYHSGNLRLNEYSKSDHTHEYIPNSDKCIVSSVSSTDHPQYEHMVPTMNFLSYWNGAYNYKGQSNLAYCKQGQFGSIVTKNTEDYLASSGNVNLAGSLTVGGSMSDVLKAYKLTPPVDRACVSISRTGSEGYGQGSFLDAAIEDLASDYIVPMSIKTGSITSGAKGNVTIGIDSTATDPGLYIKLVKRKTEVLDSKNNVVGASYISGGYADVYCGALTCSKTATATKFTTSSDIRLKEDIEQIEMSQSIKILSKLSPVSYKLKNNEDGSRDRGLIAQQLKDIMTEEGCPDQIYNESEDGMMSIAYTQLIPDIINVIKYLLYRVDKNTIEDIAESLRLDDRYYREYTE